jgi:hypothetical protein
MSYVRDIMNPGEKILLKAQISKLAFINALLTFAAVMHPFSLLRLLRTELALTNQRIIGTTGVGGRKNIALKFKDIESVVVRKGLMGWMFDFGSVIVTATNGQKTHFKCIVLPLVFQQEAEEEIERAVLGYTLAEYVPNV